MKHIEFLEKAHIYFPNASSLDTEITEDNFTDSVNLDDYSTQIIANLRNEKIIKCSKVGYDLYIAHENYIRKLPYYKDKMFSTEYYLIQENHDTLNNEVCYRITEIKSYAKGYTESIRDTLINYIKQRNK